MHVNGDQYTIQAITISAVAAVWCFFPPWIRYDIHQSTILPSAVLRVVTFGDEKEIFIKQHSTVDILSYFLFQEKFL